MDLVRIFYLICCIISKTVDAEELRDVNISKKELSELVAELYDGLMGEGVSMESIDLETPRKFLLSYQEDGLNTPNTSPERSKTTLDVNRRLNFQEENVKQRQERQPQSNNITSNNVSHHHNYSFHSDVMSIPSTHNHQNNKSNNDYISKNSENMALIPIAQSYTDDLENANWKTVSIDTNALNTQLDLIAVPIPGQPNCFKLAKIVQSPEEQTKTIENNTNKENIPSSSSITERYNVPYETNYTCKYVSVRRHVIKEYINKFESLKHAQDNKISSTTSDTLDYASNINIGFTQYQYDLMQQQLRIHVQQLTQTFVQTYCHPEFWKLASKPKEMLLELQQKSRENVNFQIWNLEPAVELIQKWQEELDEDTPENTELMEFLHNEIYATNHNCRQIPRFHPRILDCYLNSPVIMYPQYLPKMPFSPKAKIHAFSPAESYLIAMGLEKHLKIIYEKKERIPANSSPLRIACKRLCKDMVHGKRYRRVWDYIIHLQKVDYYNPIKYFFEHNKAPPVEHEPIITFENNIVLPPKDRIPELPLVYQTYLQKKNAPPKPITNKKSRKRSNPKDIKVSEAFKNSYIEFVREALGQDLPLPQNFYDSAESSDIHDSDTNNIANCAEKCKNSSTPKKAANRKLPQSLTINVNYVFGSGLNVSNTTGTSLTALTPSTHIKDNSSTSFCSNIIPQTANDSVNNCTNNLSNFTQTDETTLTNSNKTTNLPDSTINTATDIAQNNLNNASTFPECPVITYNFDLRTKTLQPIFNANRYEQTRAYCSPKNAIDSQKEIEYYSKEKPKVNKKLRKTKKIWYAFKLNKKIRQKATAYREKRNLQKRCEDLITAYSLYLDTIQLKYKEHPLLQHYYRYFRALELYTNLLIDLKYICSKYSRNMATSSNNSPSNLKRSRNTNANNEDDSNPSTVRQVRKLNKQEENLRHMLLPDTLEETNRKDAIYAFNFYEKVEEAFKASNRPEDCKKFNSILKSFDPKADKVSDLYYKLEKLFLPDHPELAQVFLTFLLPSEAAEIGKFFEHFMINNVTTFINKLNIYFNKQPAQIRKIYNCLNDLAEDHDVTMKKIESKIVPLLKGNQFLIDWFMQQFPQNTPPERLFSTAEHIINLKDQQSNRPGEYVETITDLMDSPTNDPQQQSCQLRYINGRIFYGSKMLLPAKLSFMATSYKDKNIENRSPPIAFSSVCVHGIREHGENRLQAAADLTSHTNNDPPVSDDQDKSEEDDASKTLIIDTTADEEDSCSLELCDEATFRAHSLRLNPSVYSSTYYTTANATSTPNINSNYHVHHANSKKTLLNFNEESKLSPRKNLPSSTTTNLNSPLSVLCSYPTNSRDKRKSPSKKTKSPLSNNKAIRSTNASVQPMVVIHEANSAIRCAKRLKSLIDEGEQLGENVEETIDTKDIIQIVARTKNSLKSSLNTASISACEEVKEENTEDMEFLEVDTALSPSPFPCLRMDTDSNEEDIVNSITPPPLPPTLSQPTPPTLANEEDIKIDIVTTLTTTSNTDETTTSNLNQKSNTTVLPSNTAWTREEDKIILIEMKLGSQNLQELYQRIAEKLSNRTMYEIMSRHQFLMDFLSKLQGK